MPQKSGFEPCRGSATCKWPPIGECDYLEFDRSKDSIGAAEFGFCHPCSPPPHHESVIGSQVPLTPAHVVAHNEEN